MTGVAVAAITVRFWGVCGSIACPGIEHARYGGNTACVEVRCGDRVFIFDAGTGARALGHALVRTGPVDTDIFLSHCHIDHISGLPFFAPSYSPMSRIRLWAGNLLPEYRIEKVLRTMMNEPLFPAPVEAFTAKIEFRDFRAGDVLQPYEGVALRTAMLNHPGRAAGVDLMIYDGNYTDEEWPARIGWGHSTWQEGVRLAEAANAKSLVIFHHDPDHDDRFLDRVAAEAGVRRAGTLVAIEGMTIAI